MLAEQLRELERDGLVSRTAYEGFLLRVDYALTPLGKQLNDLLDPLAQWGHEYLAARRPASTPQPTPVTGA